MLIGTLNSKLCGKSYFFWKFVVMYFNTWHFGPTRFAALQVSKKRHKYFDNKKKIVQKINTIY